MNTVISFRTDHLTFFFYQVYNTEGGLVYCAILQYFCYIVAVLLVEEIRIPGVPTHNFSGDKTLIARVVVNPTTIRSGPQRPQHRR